MSRGLALGFCVLPLFAATCFNGEEARGLPCENDAQCGTLECVRANPGDATGFCGGPPEGVTDSVSDGTAESSGDDSTGGTPACGIEPPVWCEGVAPIASPMFDQQVYQEDPGISGMISAATGYFLNDDDLIDIAVANLFEYDIILYRNVGNGFERYTIPYPLNFAPYDLASGDFDCDGNTDLAAIGVDSAEFVVAYGTGMQVGEFTQTEVVSEPWSLAVADVQGSDGRPEVIVAGGMNVFVLESTEREWDANLVAFANPPAVPWSTAVGDIDGDGSSDIVIPDSDQYDYPQMTPDRVLLFTGPDLDDQTAYVSPDFVHPIDATLLDIDGDGDRDMAVLSRHIEGDQTVSNMPGTLTLHRNDGSAGFMQTAGPITLGIGGNAITSADFDCDGDVDLAVGHDGDPDGVWILWAPDYDVAAASKIASGAALGTRMEVADLNQDGYPDLVVPSFGTLDDQGSTVEEAALYVLSPTPG